MMLREIVGIFFFILLFTAELYSAGATIEGKVLDSVSSVPLVGASVVLSSDRSDAKYHDIAGKNGEFALKEVPRGPYTLRITYIGYAAYERKIRVRSEEPMKLGVIPMKSEEIVKEGITVTGQAPIGEQKEDTTEYRADSFKTMPDATAEDLVKKMPGVQVELDGTVKAKGEDVKKVLVDGKPFFGDDPTLALRNLPAEVIDRIQIYDRMSEQAEFTGFDDGQSQRTMNIMTRSNRRSGEFGKFSGGYGSEDRYTASFNLNLFDSTRRVSLLGITNNINQQNFAAQDIMGLLGGGGGFRGQFTRQFGTAPFPRGTMRGMGGGRPGGGSSFGDFLVGQLEGNSTTHAFGLNYSDVWSDNINASGSYFFNYSENTNQQLLNREIFLEADSIQYYNQLSNALTKNINHRFNLRIDYRLDTNSSFIIRPTLSLQSNGMNSLLNGNTSLADLSDLSRTENINTSNYTGYNFSNEILFRHRLSSPGRTISVSLNTNLSDREGQGWQYANNLYSYPLRTADTLDQTSYSPVEGLGMSLRTIYTEPIADKQQLMFSYDVGQNINNSNKETYNYDYDGLDYLIIDPLLTNRFDNLYITQRAGIGYRLRDDKLSLTAQMDYQKAQLTSKEYVPNINKNNYIFDNILPSFMFNYRFDQQTNVRMHYRTSTNSPSIQQLQNVVDISNPLQLSVGNPELRQQYSHFLMGRYSSMSSDFTSIFMTFLSLNLRTDYIANSTIIARRDTVLEGNLVLPAGGQFTKPVNLSGFLNTNMFLTYGIPISLISSNVNFNLGGGYTRTPSLVNGVENYSNMYNINFQLILSSNISSNLDFTLSSRANYSITKNTLREDLNNEYNNYLTTANLNWIVWEGFFLQLEARNQIYTGLTGSDNTNFTLVNFSIGKKIFENNRGEIKLHIFDLLKQNRSIQTNISDYYYEFVNNRVLEQYIMLSFTYNLSNFGG